MTAAARLIARMSIAFALFAVPVCTATGTAVAAPTVTLKTTALPIPGFPHTGNILGAGAVIRVQYTISGTEYGGFPPPLIGVKYFAPAGSKLHPQGFPVCPPTTLEQIGPQACPHGSLAGPQGSAQGVVSFGAERVPETISVQPAFGPGGNLEFFLDGHTPASLELLATGHVLGAAPPFGLEVEGQVPLIETVPGAPDASAEQADIEIGAAYKRGGHTVSYVTVPKQCPKSGLLVRSELSFLGGATAEATYEMPCPRKK
jgi:hypothetical protein